MPERPTNVDSLLVEARNELDSDASHANSKTLQDLCSRIKNAMSHSKEARRSLGPLLAGLLKRSNSQTIPPLQWTIVLQGRLVIGHRPKIKAIPHLKQSGATHLLTLLSESEGGEEIGRVARQAGIHWLWLPLTSGDPPEEKRLSEILSLFQQMQTILECRGGVFVHCSAGIHRTGMITFAFLRYLGFSESNAFDILARLRPETSSGVGAERIEWGNRFAMQS